MRNPTPVINVTFNDGDLVWKMYAQTDFTGCTFLGTAKNCNFAEATFLNCTFDPAFSIEGCNIGGAEGLPAKFNAPPRCVSNGDRLSIRSGMRSTLPGM